MPWDIIRLCDKIEIMFRLIRSFRNIVDYPLRRLFHWQRGGLTIQNEAKDHLFDRLGPDDQNRAWEIENSLRQAYHLEYFFNHSRAGNYRENLYYLEMLARALDSIPLTFDASLVAADIGPSHWFYVQVLDHLLVWWKSATAREVTLDGFEADPYRVYTDLYSRMDHALAHMRGLDGVTYHPVGFSPSDEHYDVIFMLFPFIFIKDHLEWGLPASHFSPVELLRAAWSSVEPGGALVIVNQGEPEKSAEHQLLAQVQVAISVSFKHESLLFSYDLPRFVTVCQKPETHG